MTASILDIKRLRRMVNEPDDTIYKDEELALYLEAWPIVDALGRTYDKSDWTEGYDLHAAAADIWEEKAAAVQVNHDFSADNSSFSASQMYTNAMDQARHHRASQKASVKRNPSNRSTSTYFPDYENPIFDEDEPRDYQWTDSIV